MITLPASPTEHPAPLCWSLMDAVLAAFAQTQAVPIGVQDLVDGRFDLSDWSHLSTSRNPDAKRRR